MRTLLFTVSLLIAISANAEKVKMPTKAKVLESMEVANDYFINKYPDAGAPTYVKKMRPSNLWTRGVYFEGLVELIDIEQAAQSPKYEQNNQYLYDWASSHEWVPRNGVKTRDADDYCCCQAYLSMYEKGQVKYYNPTVQCMDNLLSTPASVGDWTWIDAIQMGLPVLTKMSAIKQKEGDEAFSRYAQQGWKMYSYTRDRLAGGLFNKNEGLWWRDKDFVPPYKEPNGKNCYWSRGNGWVYAALVRAMQDIMNMDNYDDYLDEYKSDYMKMTKALTKCQRKDMFWNVSLLDESNYGGKELTGTALFVYGMAWGIRNGLLDSKTYLPIVAKTWNAMVKECLHKNGFLGYVQGTGKQPSDSQPVGYDNEPDFDDFGLGCFLLAGSEVYQLAKD
jgi:unsaturated rhamnogalacturonyl hydrolase